MSECRCWSKFSSNFLSRDAQRPAEAAVEQARVKICAVILLSLTLLGWAEPEIRIGDPAQSDEATRYVDRETFRAYVEEIPKTELHTHLEGAVRPETILELAEQYHVDLGTRDLDTLKRKIAMQPGENLLDFLKKFDTFRFVFDHPEALRRVAYEMVEEDAAEGMLYMEIRINPVKHEEILSIDGVLDAVLEGMREASQHFGVEARLIVSINRSYLVESAMRVARAAVARMQKGVV